jgi:hypothetical protein
MLLWCHHGADFKAAQRSDLLHQYHIHPTFLSEKLSRRLICPQKSTSILFSYTHGSETHWTPRSIIRLSKVVIVVFQDSVSKETIEKYAADVVANGKDIPFGLKLETWSWYINPSYCIGGKIKDRYYESSGGINVRLTTVVMIEMTLMVVETFSRYFHDTSGSAQCDVRWLCIWSGVLRHYWVFRHLQDFQSGWD